MGYKAGIFQKLNLCWFWLTNPTFKNILTSTCEFCGSSNVIAVNKTHSTVGEDMKNYSATLICMRCKSTAKANQEWSRMSKKEIIKIKKQLGRRTSG